MRVASNLRTTMTAAVVTVALMAALAAGALMGLTAMMRSAGARSASAIEGLLIAEELQRDLLLHDRLTDPTARDQVAEGLHERLETTEKHVRSAEERDALERADAAVGAYLAEADKVTDRHDGLAAKHAEAFEALERLVAIELEHAQSARATLHRSDDVADAIGAAVATSVAIASAIVLWWLHRRALRPLFGLARAMRDFASGKFDTRANDEGPAELAEMAGRFNEMAAAIERQRKDRQTLIAGVVHDLRNPLSVLKMSTSACATQSDLPPERVTKVMGIVVRQVDRLERMVGDLLDSVNLEAGNLDLRLESHDARQIVTEISDVYRKSSASHSIELTTPAGAVPIRCDGMRIEQVLSNLLSNAIKYSPQGGRVFVGLKTTGDNVVFSVRDEGVGMTQEDAAAAFEPFRRSATVRDKVPGSGLGLFVVRRLIEAHGGHIEVYTSVGKGSTFEVWLPLAPPEPAHVEQPQETAALAAS